MNDDDLKIYEENAKLRDRVKELEKGRPLIDLKFLLSPNFVVSAILVITVALCIGGAYLVFTAPSPPIPVDRVAYCYPDGWGTGKVSLMAHHTYKEDRTISVHGNLTDAIAAAKQLGCPMMKMGARP